MLWLVQINLYTRFCALNTQGVYKIVLNIYEMVLWVKIKREIKFKP